MEPLKHECGVAMICLRKPLAHFQQKYNSWTYALDQMYLLLEKQRNRGQEGAGIACVKLHSEPGEDYMFRERAVGSGAVTEIYDAIHHQLRDFTPEQLADVNFAEKYIPFAGERYMGHLRYSTHGRTGMSYVHPFLRRNNWSARNLCICGNFGLTNVEDKHIDAILQSEHKPSAEELRRILGNHIRREKVVLKDIKLRTFITEGKSRNGLASHVYDITYGSLTPNVDNLVVIDDSIVRGTTLRESIIRILDRLHPHKLVVVSSAPQVRYPDYYGIDMTSLGEFIAFRTALDLLHQRGQDSLLDDVYQRCLAQRELPADKMVNYVKAIYEPFTEDEITHRMTELLCPADVKTPVEIVFQTLDGLHDACPNHLGDWYFSGDFPTAGGLRLLNEAYIDFYESYKH